MRDDENRRQEQGQQDSDYGRPNSDQDPEGLGHAGQGLASTDPVENITRANDEGMPQSSEDFQDDSDAGTESDEGGRIETNRPGY